MLWYHAESQLFVACTKSANNDKTQQNENNFLDNSELETADDLEWKQCNVYQHYINNGLPETWDTTSQT